MQTLINIQSQFRAIYGTELISKAARKNGVKARLTIVKSLAANNKSRIHNVETRLAFVLVYKSAKDAAERADLIDAMGVCKKTVYLWRKDYDAFNEGKLVFSSRINRK